MNEEPPQIQSQEASSVSQVQVQDQDQDQAVLGGRKEPVPAPAPVLKQDETNIQDEASSEPLAPTSVAQAQAQAQSNSSQVKTEESEHHVLNEMRTPHRVLSRVSGEEMSQNGELQSRHQVEAREQEQETVQIESGERQNMVQVQGVIAQEEIKEASTLSISQSNEGEGRVQEVRSTDVEGVSDQDQAGSQAQAVAERTTVDSVSENATDTSTSTSSTDNSLFFDCEDESNTVILPLLNEEQESEMERETFPEDSSAGVQQLALSAELLALRLFIPGLTFTQTSFTPYFSEQGSLPTTNTDADALYDSDSDSSSFYSASESESPTPSIGTNTDLSEMDLYTPPERMSTVPELDSLSHSPLVDPLSELPNQARFLLLHMSQRREQALSQLTSSNECYNAYGELGLLDVGNGELEMQWEGVSISDMTRAIRTRYGEVRDGEIRLVHHSVH